MDLHLAHDFTFNPDGSGKVMVRWSAPATVDTPAPDEFLRSELQQAVGVDAWAEPRCAVEDDRLVFTATAWFPGRSARCGSIARASIATCSTSRWAIPTPAT